MTRLLSQLQSGDCLMEREMSVWNWPLECTNSMAFGDVVF